MKEFELLKKLYGESHAEWLAAYDKAIAEQRGGRAVDRDMEKLPGDRSPALSGRLIARSELARLGEDVPDVRGDEAG